MKNREKLVKQLFVGKVSEILGFDKTLELLKEAKELSKKYKHNIIGNTVIESLPQDNFCKVCNLPTDGKKCYSNRCPI